MLSRIMEYIAQKKRAKKFKMYQLPKDRLPGWKREQIYLIDISREGTGYDYQNTAFL